MPIATTTPATGGGKNSGYGRELSAHGISEFYNLKTVWIGKGRRRRVPRYAERVVPS